MATKMTTLRVPIEVLDEYRSGGRFFQARMVESLKRGLEHERRRAEIERKVKEEVQQSVHVQVQ